MALNTELFMLNVPSASIRPTDICIIINFLLLVIANKRDKNAKSNRISKWILYILLFYIVELVLTLLSEAEYFGFALKVIRIPMILVSFYALRVIPFDDIKKFIHIGYIILIIQGILYYLQFMGIHLLTGYSSTVVERYGLAFALNSPTFLYFYIFYALSDDELSSNQRYSLFLFLFGIVLLRYVRAGIFALAISIVLYIIISKKSIRSIIISLIIAIVSPLVMNFLSAKETVGGNSTRDDIINIVSNIGNPENIDPSGGTMSFRIAMLVERAIYLRDNPKYLPLGVGTIHEDSPNCKTRFDFLIGTHNEMKQNERCMIESGDITWVPILLRYGIIGILLHVSIFFIMFLLTYKRKDKYIIFAPLSLYLFLTSFDGPLFENVQKLYFLTFVLVVIYKIKNIDYQL